MGNTKTGNPSGAKGISTGMGGRGRKRNSLDPAGGPINDGENVGMTLRGRKGSYEVNMNVGKTTGRNGNGNWRRGDMDMDFGFLTKDTLSSPKSEIFGHRMPQKAGRN